MVRASVFLALMCLVAFLLADSAEAKKVGMYLLKKGNFSVKMTNWGATIMAIVLPDSKGTDDHTMFRYSENHVAFKVPMHLYLNLGGQGSGDVLGHTLRLFASRYTPMDEELLPSSGRVDPVAGTNYDFRTPTPINYVSGGKGLAGYDINYVIDGDGMRKVAAVRDDKSGRRLKLWANQPAMQLYTGNGLNDTIKGKGGNVYGRYGGFCLETQGYPDAVNHPEFPSQTLRPGQVYKHDMVHKFSF
ncbi:unnamed protein product [Alopecurus aequalis]